jgi:glucokinase
MPEISDPRICVDIGASHVRVAISRGADLTGVAEHRVADLEREYEGDVLSAVEEAISKVVADLPGDSRSLPPIGVGVASVVDAAGSLRAPLGQGIPRGTGLRDRLSARFRTQVVVDNDASLAALGEAVHGVGKGERNLVLITLGSNIGMGIVADGAIYRGARGAAGEVGTLPVPLDPGDSATWERVLAARAPWTSQAAPPEGYVWVEELYGGMAMARSLAHARAADGRPRAADVPAIDRVLPAAAAGDGRAQSIVDEAVRGWALAIATVCGVLDPGLVVLGGGIVDDLLPFLPQLRSETTRFLPHPSPPIELATLGTTAGLVGAGVAARGLPWRRGAAGELSGG